MLYTPPAYPASVRPPAGRVSNDALLTKMLLANPAEIRAKVRIASRKFIVFFSSGRSVSDDLKVEHIPNRVGLQDWSWADYQSAAGCQPAPHCIHSADWAH